MLRFLSLPIVFIIIVLFMELPSILACESNQMGNGCRITNGQCSCGYGCKSEFRYETMGSCKLALSGEVKNACFQNTRCLHGGTCLQVTSTLGYKCSCVGTRYFGPRCDKPCPGPDNPHYHGPFPIECISI